MVTDSVSEIGLVGVEVGVLRPLEESGCLFCGDAQFGTGFESNTPPGLITFWVLALSLGLVQLLQELHRLLGLCASTIARSEGAEDLQWWVWAVVHGSAQASSVMAVAMWSRSDSMMVSWHWFSSSNCSSFSCSSVVWASLATDSLGLSLGCVGLCDDSSD